MVYAFFNTKHTVALCFATCLAFSSSAIADIVISGTRVIYTSDQKSVNVRLENKGNNPLLVQSWLDTGDDTPTWQYQCPIYGDYPLFHVLTANAVKQSS